MIECPLFDIRRKVCMIDKADGLYCPSGIDSCCMLCKYSASCDNACEGPRE